MKKTIKSAKKFPASCRPHSLLKMISKKFWLKKEAPFGSEYLYSDTVKISSVKGKIFLYFKGKQL